MKSILNQIRKYASCCLNCGSVFSNLGCLCTKCDGALEYWQEEETKQKSFAMRTLYVWIPGQSDLLSRLILWLKGSHQKLAWHHYAQKMARHHAQYLPHGFKIYVVPAPPRRKNHHDHAAAWAEGLAQALGAQLVPCLRKTGEYSQRGADRGTRALIEMEIIENSTDVVDLKSQAFWIFADDIVTTGSTARSAHIALGTPKHFEVWALAKRTLSCGASKDLL